MSHTRLRELRRVPRRPLADATDLVNNALSQTPIHSPEACSSASLDCPGSSQPSRTLRVVNGRSSQASNVGDLRLSALPNPHPHDSNRNSQVSTTSTNASGKSRRKTHVGPWRLGTDLGRGMTARVRLARHVVTGQEAAVKIISKAAASAQKRRHLTRSRDRSEAEPDEDRRLPFGIEREVVIMKLIEHPNVVRLYDVWENHGEL